MLAGLSMKLDRTDPSPPHARGEVAGQERLDRSATLRAYDTNAWAIDRTVIGGLPECPPVLQMAFVIRLEGGGPARSSLLA
jgi:hypothetical protein